MSRYKPYSAYKDSGVDWIGSTPVHWSPSKLKYAISHHQNGVWGDDPIGDSTDTLCLRVADFDREQLRIIESPSTYRQVGAEHLKTRLVNQRDILLEKSGGGEKTLVGANVQYLGTEKAICSNFVAVIRPSQFVDPTWLNYKMAAMYSQNINIRSIKQATGIQNLDSESYFDEGVVIPPIEEQLDISLAIDRETTRIDSLIAKKTRFIELLKEKRQALITHAVTKGLDPNVKMKYSGVEWIGEVPEHWTISKLKYLSKALLGLTYAPEDVVTDGSGITVLRSSNIQGGQLDMADIVRVRNFVGSELMAQVGDILICSRNGSRALIGKNIQLDQRSIGCTFGAFMTVVRSKFNDYLYFIFNSTMFDANSALYMTSTVNQLTISMIDNMEVPLPPETEQAVIVSHLRAKLGSLDTLLAKTQRSIDLLKERRSAFITAAVTGQIDLREGK